MLKACITLATIQMYTFQKSIMTGFITTPLLSCVFVEKYFIFFICFAYNLLTNLLIVQESIAKMTEQQVRELLLRTVEKEPSLLQEIMEMTAPPQPVVPSQPVLPNQPAGPATGEDGAEAPGGGGGAEAPGGGGAAEGLIVQPWCICTFCTEMPTPAENLCCGKQPEQCISRLAVSFTMYTIYHNVHVGENKTKCYFIMIHIILNLYKKTDLPKY